MNRTTERSAAGACILLLAIGACQGDDGAAVESGSDRPALAGAREPTECAALGEGRLAASLLTLQEEGDIERAVEGCLSVSEEDARAFALGYASVEMGMQGPLRVRLVLPVEDSRGALLAHHVVLSTLEGGEGYGPLVADVAPLLEGLGAAGDPSFFARAHEATSRAFFTIDVAARFFRHPVRWAHRGIPRWLAESSEIPASTCINGGTPSAVLPAAELAGAGRIIRYECGAGATFLFSHHSDRVYAESEVRTLHQPVAVFQRWAGRVSTGYDDPAARLRFTEDLWARFVHEGRQP